MAEPVPTDQGSSHAHPRHPLTHRHTVLGWVDLVVPDGDVAREFYAAVPGWTYADTDEEFGHYQMVNTKVAQQPASARCTAPTSHRPG